MLHRELNLIAAPGQLRRSVARRCGMVKITAGASKYMAERDSMRTFRLIGAAAALLAVLGIAILVFWAAIRLPRF